MWQSAELGTCGERLGEAACMPCIHAMQGMHAAICAVQLRMHVRDLTLHIWCKDPRQNRLL